MSKKFYITTSIPYTNAFPHIGFALEIIQADVLARYHRQSGKEVFFLTGTDEHGLKTKQAAQAVGKDPEQFTYEISQKFSNLKYLLNISNDDFIRTTDKIRHLPAVKKLWEKISEKGDFYKKKYKGFYCQGCEAFKTQKELLDGKCVIHQQIAEEIEEENYFFRLSKYLLQVKKIIEKNIIKIVPRSKKNEILQIIKGGLEDVSFSRNKEKYWGIEVPGDPSQIIYVWADALPNYISAIGYANNPKKFKRYWPADLHCIGKDIVKFHAIYWPAMLLSLKLALPSTLFVHGFINVEGRKMSKSLGNVVDPFQLVQKYGADAVRYYLLREISSTEDGDFSYKKFEQRYSADLAAGLGNLLSRVVALTKESGFKEKKTSLQIKKAVSKTGKEYKFHLKRFAFHESLKSIWELISFCDKYINENKPWENGKNSYQVISDCLFVLNTLADFLSSFLPKTAESIKKSVTTKDSNPLFPRVPRIS